MNYDGDDGWYDRTSFDTLLPKGRKTVFTPSVLLQNGVGNLPFTNSWSETLALT